MRARTISLLLAGALILAGLYALAHQGASGRIGIPTSPPYSLSKVEIADEPDERALGLGGRPEIPDDYGMLFVFEVADTYGFWMDGMLVPIDIIWLSDDGYIVGIEPSVPVESFPETFQPNVPVRYVLETRAGLAAERGWAEGTRVSLPI